MRRQNDGDMALANLASSGLQRPICARAITFMSLTLHPACCWEQVKQGPAAIRGAAKRRR